MVLVARKAWWWGWWGWLPELPDTEIFVWNDSDVATAVPMSWDAIISNAWVVTIADDVVTNGKLANMIWYTVKARLDWSTGNPSDLPMSLHSALIRNGGNIISADAWVNTVLRRLTGNTLEFWKLSYDNMNTSVQQSLDLADLSLQTWDNISELVNDEWYVKWPNGAKPNGIATYADNTWEEINDEGNNAIGKSWLIMWVSSTPWAKFHWYNDETANEVQGIEQYRKTNSWQLSTIWNILKTVGTWDATPTQDNIQFSWTRPSRFALEFFVMADSLTDLAVFKWYARVTVSAKSIHTVDNVVIISSDIPTPLIWVDFDIVQGAKTVFINWEYTGIAATDIYRTTRYRIYQLTWP